MKTKMEQWRSTGGRCRSFFAVLPVLALLALALAPMSARAESSSEVVYNEGPPGLESVGPQKTGKSATPTKDHPRSHANHKRHGSKTSTAGEETAEPMTESEGEPHPEGHRHSGAAPSGKGGNHPPGGGEPGKNGSPRPAGDPARKQVRNISPGPGTAPNRTSTSGVGGGGSSPLLPVLIAMAVLAAASIGLVLYRQRNQDDGVDGYTG